MKLEKMLKLILEINNGLFTQRLEFRSSNLFKLAKPSLKLTFYLICIIIMLSDIKTFLYRKEIFMSIRSFENLYCSQLENLIRDGYKVDLFQMETHIFLSIHHQTDLFARAVGESILTVLQRAESYVDSNFSMPELYNEHTSKLDSLILNGSQISLECMGVKFRGKIISDDEYLLTISVGNSISQTLQFLEESAIQYGL